MDSETLDLSARNLKKLAVRTKNHHARKVVNLRGVKTATTVKANVNLKTEMPGNAMASTKNLDLVVNPLVKASQVAKESRAVAVQPLVKASQVAKLNLGKENPLPVRREILKAPNEATAIRNPNKTPTAKKLLSNATVENNL
jgi:molybdopterin biosynthesis enzyme